MGITIYYKGSLKPEIEREEVLDIIQDMAKSLEWKYENVNDEENDLLGVIINPHLDCESLDFVFTNSGQLINIFMYGHNIEKNVKPVVDNLVELCFCKTQFSNFAIHITIIKLLDFLKNKYFKSMEIVDDGGYYPDGDTEELIHRMDLINEGMDILQEALQSEDYLNSNEKIDNEEELIKKIEKFFQNALARLKRKNNHDNSESN